MATSRKGGAKRGPDESRHITNRKAARGWADRLTETMLPSTTSMGTRLYRLCEVLRLGYKEGPRLPPMLCSHTGESRQKQASAMSPVLASTTYPSNHA